MLTLVDFELQRSSAMRVRTGRGNGAAKTILYTCHNLEGVIVTPHSVILPPPIVTETLHFLCSNGFRVGRLEVNK